MVRTRSSIDFRRELEESRKEKNIKQPLNEVEALNFVLFNFFKSVKDSEIEDVGQSI
jgi:hypothetical protein